MSALSQLPSMPSPSQQSSTRSSVVHTAGYISKQIWYTGTRITQPHRRHQQREQQQSREREDSTQHVLEGSGNKRTVDKVHTKKKKNLHELAEVNKNSEVKKFIRFPRQSGQAGRGVRSLSLRQHIPQDACATLTTTAAHE